MAALKGTEKQGLTQLKFIYTMAATPEQLHALLLHCIDFSRTMLEKSGEFYPFGGTLSTDGKVCAVGGDNGEEHPKPQEIFLLLAEAFSSSAQKGEILGAALVADVNIPSHYAPNYPDGVRVQLESEGFSRFIYIPYKIKKSGILRMSRQVEMAEPFSVEIEPSFFKVVKSV
ncbi:hypothetical protein H8K35_10455 [Undibacterium sp. LX40W]|uniref:Uncharacterized protein n=1 Tax=Undibacterium nitidum TaxID=2762298 RepID=A0A923HP06_9BURK|nr:MULTISPECIES: hypothetical protein [Undibacterium]MBC3881923.1 hypothetical protein [Undibacterium nitidum]MBC3892080.1 hypothetical protein [Undibacterium sp. LX40W]